MNKKDYRILMITLNSAWKHGNIGIDQLSGYLRENDFSVDIAYFRTRDPINDIFEAIKDDYSFYGFSVTSASVAKCYKLAKLLKEYRKDVVIDFGGGYATRYYREMFSECEYIDFITLGDGEQPTEHLLNNIILDNGYINTQETKHFAVASRNDQSNKHQFTATSITHFPAFDYYERDTAVRNSRKVHCIQTKNNICTGNCTFCTERHGKVYYKDISQIIEQIKLVHLKYGIQKFFFTDDNIFDPNDRAGKEHVQKLCVELLKLKTEQNLKLVYQCYIKAISLRDTPEDNDLLKLMKEVGFVEIFVGIESGDNDDLKLYNKHTTVDDNYVIIDLLKRHGLFPIIGFIAFNPYSTFKKIENNFKFLCDVKCTYLPNYLYSFVNINKYTAFHDMIKCDKLVLSPDNQYINIQYKYQDPNIEPILRYIETNMVPRLKEIQYETDWIIYSYMEHRILYDIDDLSEKLSILKDNDFAIIQKYLSILFIDHDLERFKSVEDEFWSHFINQQAYIKSIYEYLIAQHTLSSCLKLYTKQLHFRGNFESRKCNDVIIGEYCSGELNAYFKKDSRKLNAKKLNIEKGDNRKIIVIVLESPHIHEYDGDFVSPALGTTGNNLDKHFGDILKYLPLNENYRIILMNSIQYQCSLGEDTHKYRDNMWLKLWFKEKLKENFKKRMSSYNPDIVFNFCTNGGHLLQADLPPNTKTKINEQYINHCIAPLNFHNSKNVTLRSLVTEAIADLEIKPIVYEGNHPAAWRIKNNSTPEEKAHQINLKKVLPCK